MSFAEFIDMGGHGFYVWSCYLVTLVIFLGLYLSINSQHKKLIKQLKRRYQRETLMQTSQSEQTAELDPNTAELGVKD